MLSSAFLQRNRQEIKTTPIHIHNVSKQHIFLNKGALMIKHSTGKEEYNIKNCPFYVGERRYNYKDQANSCSRQVIVRYKEY